MYLEEDIYCLFHPPILFLEKLEGTHKECKTAYRALLFLCLLLFISERMPM
jgi:hypothetical protein